MFFSIKAHPILGLHWLRSVAPDALEPLKQYKSPLGVHWHVGRISKAGNIWKAMADQDVPSSSKFKFQICWRVHSNTSRFQKLWFSTTWIFECSKWPVNHSQSLRHPTSWTWIRFQITAEIQQLWADWNSASPPSIEPRAIFWSYQLSQACYPIGCTPYT